MTHVEFRDFTVVYESVKSTPDEHIVMGRGGDAIAPGDVIETRYRDQPERHRVRSISREEGLTMWAATVVPAPTLRLVA
ncbi:hypothetical protein B2G69_08180 [Methylorubrum zatmanii]|nr:hypothetical protein [Methylorubrum zatmanii]ARO54126.1 hypothetical protein B2G69_08180 [Methylorubrum zatmanii]